MSSDKFKSLATEFRNVDKTDFNKIYRCLSFVNQMHCYNLYKRRSFELMNIKEKDTIVDLGCGLGFDLERLSEIVPNGQIIGVDSSSNLLEATRKRIKSSNVKLVHSDIHKLPFDSNSVDSVRVDRTLQHVEKPHEVIKEMHRILKPGGIMVCVDPDWQTFIINAGSDETVPNKVGKIFANKFKNPHIGRILYDLFLQNNLQNIDVEGHVLVTKGFTEVDTVFDLKTTVEEINLDDVRAWLNKVQEKACLSASVTLFLVKGIK
jgi:ubiquinone/menaquinone biosynthesis C-methylase UbiE